MGAEAPTTLLRDSRANPLGCARASLAGERGEDTGGGKGVSGCASFCWERGDSAAWGASGCGGLAEEAGLRAGPPIRAGDIPELRGA